MLLQVLVAIFLILLIVDRWKPRRFVKLHQQIGNDLMYLPIIGNGISLLGNNEDRMNFGIECTLKMYRNKHKAMSFWVGSIFGVGLCDADQACAVLKSALDKNFIHHVTKDFIGNGSIYAPVEIWHPRRKILVPTFAPRIVDTFVSVFEKQSKMAAELIESRVGKGDFSCFDSFNAYSLDSVCKTLFGTDMNIKEQPDHEIFVAIKEGFKNVAFRVCQPWLHIDAIYKLLPVYTRHMGFMKTLNNFIDDMIYKKRAHINEKKRNVDRSEDPENISEQKLKSFLELMIENSEDNNNKGYTNEELREESMVLALAATDTSTTATCFTMLLLSQYPEVQDKVYKEIQDVFGDTDKPLQAGDLMKLKYTRAVIKESLRLYPPSPFVLRLCKKDLELPGGLVLPNGCNVLINIWGIHRCPEYWGEDANDFNPERFMSGKISTPNAFLPFSYGARNCVGQHYAMLSITTSLVTFLRQYRVNPATNFTIDKRNSFRLSFDIMLKNVDNYLVQIEHRDKCKQDNMK